MKTTTIVLSVYIAISPVFGISADLSENQFQKTATEAVAGMDMRTIYLLTKGLKHDTSADAFKKCEAAAEVLLRLIDKDFDPSKSPAMNVRPPASANWLSGGSDPAGIKDPVVRAEYEKAIAETRAIADHHLIQSTLCDEVVGLLEHANLLRSNVEGARKTKPEIEAQVKTFVSQRKGTEAAGDVVLKWLRIRRPTVLPIDKGTSPK